MLRILLAIFLFILSPVSAFSKSNYISRQIQLGDNLISILKKQGFNESQRQKVLKHQELRQLVFLPDTNYLVKKVASLTEIRIHSPYQKKAFIISKKNGVARVRSYTPDYKVTHHAVSGKIRTSLQAALLQQIKSNWVASRFMDAYKIDGKNFSKLAKNSEFALVVEKKYEFGHFVKYGEVLKTRLEVNGRMITKKFVPVGQGGFFIANSPAKGSKKLFAPVNYIRLASTFHPSRLHPVTKRYQAHLGVDFELPEGAPILAAKSGRVVRFGYQKAAGNYIVLAHGNGIETYYNHLKSFAGNIRKGAAIKAGQVIGSNGCTGYCTKPHLHFALKKNGKMVDPLPFMKPYAAPAEKLIAARF